MKRISLFVVLVCLCLFFSACGALVIGGIGAAVGAGGYHYYQGELKGELNARFIDAWQASKKAIEGMGYVLEETKHKETEGKIKATKVNDEPVTVTLKYLTYDRTEIAIRVGFFGDKERSLTILDAIKKRLGLK